MRAVTVVLVLSILISLSSSQYSQVPLENKFRDRDPVKLEKIIL
jgi:hypothetical protein